MSAEARLTVTGSTGALGGQVARRLSELGADQRLLVRRPEKAPALPGAEVVVADYADGAAAARALAGTTTVFMVSGAESATRVEHHRSFVDAAAAAGVEHIVYTSFYGAAPDCTFTLGRDHHATEQLIREAGLAFTFLRNNFYLDIFGLFFDEEGVLRGPAGDGRVAAVSRADIAAAAAAVLTDPGVHRGRTYDLTGPAALGLHEIAQHVGAATGRDLRYLDETLSEARASRAGYGVPDWQVDAWVSTYTAIARGELDRVTGDVEALTGRPPESMTDLLARQHPDRRP